MILPLKGGSIEIKRMLFNNIQNAGRGDIQENWFLKMNKELLIVISLCMR